jgi:fructose-1,6-bisphosphatase II
MKSLELVRATEEAAIAASKWVGGGDKLAADKAATEAMRHRLNKIPEIGKIVIGEGKKDNSHGLFSGELVGYYPRPYTGQGSPTDYPSYDIAVDPIDGTRPTANGGPEAMSVMAASQPGTMWSTEYFYMKKLAYGPRVAASSCCPRINDPIEKIIMDVAVALGKETNQLTVCILDRPRHLALVEKIRDYGVRIKLIMDCDISGAIAVCRPDSGIDLLVGAGGAPEAVITACAMKCLKGGLQAVICDQDMQVIEERVYETDDLVKGPCAFAATGITDGSLLKGVRMTPDGITTQSVYMRSESGTVRWLTTVHGN